MSFIFNPVSSSILSKKRKMQKFKIFQLFFATCGQVTIYFFTLFFQQVISSIDIQSIEPVDQKMRDSLTKSVQLAIEISTK